MVQLTEVVDEHFKEGQPGPEDDDDFTDNGMCMRGALCAQFGH
jgi:hypothetical protein